MRYLYIYTFNKGIVSNALHPGGIMTGLQKFVTQDDWKQLGMIDEHGNFKTTDVKFKSIEQGASTSVWAAVAEELDGVGGLYLENCSVSKPTTGDRIFKEHAGYLDYVLSKESAMKLWNLSMEWAEKPPK